MANEGTTAWRKHIPATPVRLSHGYPFNRSVYRAVRGVYCQLLSADEITLSSGKIYILD